MRFAIDARLVYYTQAGIGQYTIRLIRALAALNQEDQFLILQSRKHPDPIVRQHNFRRIGLWTPSHNRFEQFFLPLELLRVDADVLHSPDFIPPLYCRRFRFVITIHDLHFLIYPKFLTEESARYYGQIDRAVQHAHHIIVPSEATKQDTINLLGVPESKITVISEAANPLFRPIPRREALAKVQARFPGLPSDFILFVGTLEPRKNLPTLLRAYQHLREAYRLDAELVFVGRRGWLVDDLFHQIDEMGLRDYCHFLGRVADEDLLYLLNAARCLTLPAHYEGFGLPPLEAMACGTPVVVSNVASLPEVVGDAGLLVDPNNWEELAVALWRVLTDEQLANELRQKGLQRASLFSWERAAQETLAVYRQVAAQPVTQSKAYRVQA
ncbi:MAG TPA: glycosyltransferase family 4 protein [Caldilineae bacterium]|nr:glycosyltransferase family 4 protein [Caldilineae bacterium]